MELRVLANLSQDRALCEAFICDQDVHQATAAKLFRVAPERISHQERQVGKQVNFGMVFGQTPWSLSRQLGVSLEQAEHWNAEFYCGYPGVADFVAEIKRHVETSGIVTTTFGRRRRLPLACSNAQWERQRALRQAVNFVVQGTAADLNKLALSRLYPRLPQGVRTRSGRLSLAAPARSRA